MALSKEALERIKKNKEKLTDGSLRNSNNGGTYQNTTGGTTASSGNSSGGSSTLSESALERIKANKAKITNGSLRYSPVDNEYINAFISDASRYATNYTKKYGTLDYNTVMSDAFLNEIDGMKATEQDLRSRARQIQEFLYNNRGQIDADVSKELGAFANSFNSFNGAYRLSSTRDDMSNYNSQEEYDWHLLQTGVDNESRKQRQDWWNETETTLKTLEEIDKEYTKLTNTANSTAPEYANGRYRPGANSRNPGGQNRVTPVGYTGADNEYSKQAAELLKKNGFGSIDELRAEIEDLNAKRTQYERGEGGFAATRDLDDYHLKYMGDEAFLEAGAYRDYGNASVEDLMRYKTLNDAETWTYDVDGTIRSADGTVIVEDGKGGYINPDSIGMNTVNDRLGLFLTATEEEKQMALGTSMGTWRDVYAEGSVKHWDLLTKDEITLYYGLRKTQGEKAANKFLEDIQLTLDQRATYSYNERDAKRYEEANALEKILLNIATVPKQLESNVFGAVEDAIALAKGEDINPYSAAHGGMHFTQTIRGKAAEDINEFTGAKDSDWFTWGDAYQSGMSLLDSLTAMGVAGTSGGVLLAMGAAENEAYSLYQQGASTEQIALGAAAAGAAELIFESLSLGELDKIKNIKSPKTLGQFFKVLLVQGGVEASEEMATEIANTIADAFIMGSQSDWEQLKKENGGDIGKALLNKTLDVLHAGLSGLISGGLSGGLVGTASYHRNLSAFKNAGGKVTDAGAVDSLKKLAMEVSGGKGSIARQANKVKSDSTSWQNRVNVGRLYQNISENTSDMNRSDIAKALEENGIAKKDAVAIADAMIAKLNGWDLTTEQGKLLDGIEDNAAVKAVEEDIVSNMDSDMSKRRQQMRAFSADVAIGMLKNDLVKELKDSTEKEFTPEGIYETSDNGKAIRTDTEAHEEIDIAGVAEIGNGKLILKLADGQTIDAKSVSFGNKNDALIYEAVAKLGDNIDAESANKLISQYKGGDAMVFARGIAQAYTYGFYGIDSSELFSKYSLADKLTEEQRNFAYVLGKEYRPVADKLAKDRAGEKMAKTGKTPGEKGVYYRDKDGNATDIDAYFEQDKRHLNDLQKSGIEMMRKMSEMMGIRFNVFESWTENGKSYYLNQNGKVVEGDPNGFYDTVTGEIYIALNAGNDYQGTMVFTIAHEVAHFMRQWSPEHFRKIAEIVFQHGGMKGNVSELIALKQKTAKDKGKPISYDVAMEEVVADCMETILKNGKVVQFMADVKQKDHTGWQKLKGWFMKLAKFLRAYIGKSGYTVEGQKVAEFSKDLLRQIEQIYAEGAVASGENYQEVVDGYKAEQAQFSTANMQGAADGAVVQSEATTEITSKEQPRTEYEAFPKQLMSLADGAGTILHSIEGLTPTKIQGLTGKAINGYTGRDVRGWAMGINGFTTAQVQEVNKFMDTMADFMEEAGVTYKFIGLQDVQDAKLHYTYNSDGSIKSIVLSAMVKNGDYPVNFDLSSICKKRVAMSKLIDKLARRGSLDSGTVKLTPANIFRINTALKDAGYETACLGCFVESKRYNSLEWAKKFCNKWNAAVKKVNPNATYFGYGDASFSEDSFTLEQAVKIDSAATKYITATKTERLQNALAKYKAKEQAGQPLVESFSKAAIERLVKSETISEELKTKYLNSDPTSLNIADVEFLLENGILPGAALTNKQAVTEMVKSGEAYQHLLRPSDLLTDRGISKLEALPNFHGVLYGHYGSGTPKLMQSYTPYNSEIALLPAKKGDLSLAEYLYSIAGVRMQSFSDFQIQNIYDYLQMVGDLAARKVPAHAYTKEISFAKLLGMTGIKVNLSVMFDIDPMVDKAHAGLTKLNKLVHRGEYAVVVLEDEQGKWVYNIGDYQTQKLFAEAYPDEAKRFLQSIGFGDAVKLQSSPGYSSNCGIIGVGYSDLGIIAMLNDSRIRYIIPYHASSLPAEIKLATNIALGTDYTPYQNNMKIKEIVDRNGNKVNWTIKEAYKRLGSGQAVINELNEKIRTEGWVVSTSKAQTGHGSYGLYEDLQQTNDPRQTASNFMDWCIGNSTLPLFYQFASHENYYKMLYDYNVYDCVTEEYAPQQAVTNTYPTMVDGQVQPGNVTDGGFDADYFMGAIDKQMAFMDEYSRNLDEDLDALAENMEKGTLFSDRDTVKFANRGYDFTKSFEQQIDDYRAGIFPQSDTLLVGPTPNVLLKIGLNRLPVTYGIGHLRDVLRGNKTDHDFGEAILKQLPRALKKPVAVIASQTQASTSLVAILELSHGGKQIISALYIDGDGMQNNIEIDANAVTTMHKRSNAMTLLRNAINAEVSGSIGVYYLDENKTTRLLQHQGLQLPNILKKPGGYIHSITDPNSPVKPKLGSVLESKQFINWFGDWMNDIAKASKVVNSAGEPLVMWHGTNAKFDTFDRKKIGSGGAGRYLGYGFNFAASEDTARSYGAKNLMPVYLNIRNGLSSKEKTIGLGQVNRIIRQLDSGIDDISYSMVWDYSSAGYNITPRDSAGDIAAKYNVALREAARSIYETAESDADIYSIISIACTDSDAVIEAFKVRNYDGVLWYRNDGNIQYAITFDSNQSKSIYNVGTYSKETGNVYYSDRDSDGKQDMSGATDWSNTSDYWGGKISDGQAKYFANSVVRIGGKLVPVYHGTDTDINSFVRGYSGRHSKEDQGFFWAAFDKEYANDYADGVVKKGYLNITKILDIGNIDSYTDYDRRAEELSQLINVSKEEFDARMDEKGYNYIYQLTGSKWFMDKVVENGYDGVLAWESGLKTFGFIDSNQFKNADNTNPTYDPDIRYSERASNKELAEMDETALYIKNTDKANYIGMILNGTKTEETRSRRTLDAFIGKDFYVTDGKYVYGSIVLGEPHKYTEAEFHKRENQRKHRVPTGDEYDIKPGGIKWAYPIESYKRFDKPKKLSDSTEYKNSFQAREVLYQDRTEDSVSNRALLANAFEGIAKPEEMQKLQEYKEKIALINAEEKKLRELNAQIKELSFAKGPKDTKKLKELRFDANQAANRVNTYDKQLLRLEASQPLQDVLAREKKRAYAKAAQRGREALAEYKAKVEAQQKETAEKWRESRHKAVESHERTVLRNKIRSVVGELNQLLLNEDKKRHVPDNLKRAVADALALVNMDTVGADERIAKYEAMIAKEEAKANPDQDKIDAYTVTLENIKRKGDEMGQKLKDLRDAYEEIQNSDDPDIANGYDPVIAGSLKELAESIGDTPLRNMTNEQLQDVYDMYKMVLTRVRDANKSLIESIKESISNRASRVVGEVRATGGDHKYRASILDPIKGFFWNNAKPVYAMEHIGSSTMTEAFNQVRKGEDTWAKDVAEARAYYIDKSKKYGYDSWDFDKKHTFKSTSEQEFELTLEQIMALYAYSKRDQAFEHLRLGGFVFDSSIEVSKENEDGRKSLLKYKVNTADAHQLTPEILANIIGTLTEEQRGFVDEMQNYLSTVMGAKGNEVTMKMYGVKLFKEKFYFPLKSAKQFMFEQNEVSGEVRIKNSGFTNKTKPKANNPIILNNFMDVWANHVNDMSMYHSFVLPLEDFNRIFNYNSPKQDGVPPVSVKGTIQNAYTPAAVNYVKQLITDLNGGAMADPRETLAKSLTAKFKKAKVFSSLSVVIQQPSAIGRAFALVDLKYFHPTKDGMNHDELWAELKQYAPVAIIKEMGYFDTNMGKSTQDFIKAKEYTTFKEKAKAVFTDSAYRDELLSKAPALADELTWCAIWNAVKRETLDKHPGLDIKSEPFLMLAGARFTEVITKTQVYDSVLARSANMRSKGGLMSMITAFMAEPTTSINMLEDALRKRKRGYKGYAARAFASVAVSVIINNALVALVYAGRDDDEDETYAEKYMQAFVSGMLDDINPLTYLPFVKDMWSIFQGYDVERSDMSLVSDLADGVKGLVKAYTSEDGDVVGAWHDIVGSIANIGGVPMDNIRREINGAINFFSTIIEDVNGRATTLGSMGDALLSTVKDSTPIWGWLPGDKKSDNLYDAIISGDTAYVNRLKGSYKTEDAYHNAVRQALRENDPRIMEAAKAQVNGDPSERVRIQKLIIADGFVQDDVVAATNTEINKMKPDDGNTTKKVKGYYTAEDFALEIANGDQASANAVKVDIIQTEQKNGKTAEDAEKSFKSSAKDELKDLYLADKISADKAINALVTYCGIERDDAVSDIQYWDFKQDYPEVFADDAWIDEYYEEVESSGISLKVFVEYRNKVKGITGENKKVGRMAVIHSLPITVAQKDALYYAEGWAASKLYEAPWH